MKLRLRPVVFAINVVISFVPGVAPTFALDGNQAVVHDYLALCADCHGEDARGNGPVAKNLTKSPPDLTQISKRAGGTFNEKAVFDWIVGLNMPASHGTREMPIWGDWLMDEAVEDSTSLEAAEAAETEVRERVMALVKFLKTLQR